MKKLILISALLFSFNGWAECNISEDYDVWRECILKERAKAESKTKKQSKSKKVDNQGSTQSRSTNNQSQQLSTYDLCLQRLQSSRKNYQCTVPPTKQGGWGGFAVQVNACRAQAQRAYPDSICYGISQPRYEAPQQNNSVQLCNFKCWGGQIVQGDCNTPAVTVNGKSCPRM